VPARVLEEVIEVVEPVGAGVLAPEVRHQVIAVLVSDPHVCVQRNGEAQRVALSDQLIQEELFSFSHGTSPLWLSAGALMGVASTALGTKLTRLLHGNLAGVVAGCPH